MSARRTWPSRSSCAVESGFSVAFFRLEELLAAMRRDADVSPSKLRRRKSLNVALLVVDEVGFERMSRQDASLFFRLSPPTVSGSSLRSRIALSSALRTA